MLYEDRVNIILDKVLKYGVISLNKRELYFLDSFSSGDFKVILDKYIILEDILTFENTHFKFELNDTIIGNHEVSHKGVMYVPDITINGNIVEGNLDGELVVYKNGTYVLNFEKIINYNKKKIIYDICDFCDGLEYEFDNFIDYIIQELE